MFGRIFLGDEATWNSLIILATYLHIECISLKVVIWRPFSGQSAICVIRRNEVGPPYLHPQLRQTVDWWIKSIGTHLQMCGELSLLIRRARQRPVGQWMAFNGPGDAGVAFSIFRRKKKDKEKVKLFAHWTPLVDEWRRADFNWKKSVKKGSFATHQRPWNAHSFCTFYFDWWLIHCEPMGHTIRTIGLFSQHVVLTWLATWHIWYVIKVTYLAATILISLHTFTGLIRSDVRSC